MAETAAQNNQNPEEDLIQTILQSAPSQEIAAALLVGSYGESGQNPYASGSGGGGAFGFTPPNYPAYLETAPPPEQVAAILPSYETAAANVPPSIRNSNAQAEWIALNAERPLNYEGESAQIQQTDAPTSYGANYSYNVQNWNSVIVPELSGQYTAVPASFLTGSGGVAVPSKSNYDPFTEAMLQLDAAMHATGISSLVIMPISRGLFALGFGILGFIALTGIASGGKLSGSDLPGIVAGFAAGAEVGTSNLLRKVGGGSIRRTPAGETDESRARLALSQQRAALSSQIEQRRQSSETTRTVQRAQALSSEQQRRAEAPQRAARSERRLRIDEAREARLRRRRIAEAGGLEDEE